MTTGKDGGELGGNLAIYADRGVTRIDIFEETLTGATEINEFAARVSQGVSKLGNPNVVINCEHLTWISSRMLGVLI